ncbi:MAG TPA: hypothetical protein VH744_07785, partial [Terriglobales bacterium]
ALLPSLLENSSVSEESLIELGVTGSREVIETMLKSSRVIDSLVVLQALSSNANLTESQSQAIRAKLAPISEEVFEASVGAEDPDNVLDEEFNSYLTQHANELAADGDKAFHPIGGFYDELGLELDEPRAEAAAAGSSSTSSAHRQKTQKKSQLSHEEERGSALQKISKLDVKGRIQLAFKGTKEERSILIRDGTKLVALAVLESPKVTDGEVEKFAAQKNVLEAVLRAISMKRRFVKHYPTVRNLVFNPRTPLDVSLGLIKNLLTNDLKNLSGNKDVCDTIRRLGLKMFKQKINPMKKDV